MEIPEVFISHNWAEKEPAEKLALLSQISLGRNIVSQHDF